MNWYKRCSTVLLCVVAFGCLALQSSAAADSWKAGVARVRITPNEPMWMAGYASRTKPAEGKYTELWARTLILEDPDEQRGALVSLDLVGIDRQLSHAIRESLKRQFGLRRAEVALCFSHTHSGPVVGKNLEPLHYRQVDQSQQRLIDRYARRLQKYISECVAAAIADLQPCQLSWGSGTATFAVNRRNNPAAEVEKLRAADALKGPDDHDVPILAVRDNGGELRAIVFGYACHATVLNHYSWCGDYPGFAAAELESRYDGCTALFWTGCGADQNPLPRRKLQLAQQYGKHLAESVREALRGDMQPITGSLDVSYKEVPLAFDQLPTKAELEQAAASENKYERARAEMLLENIAHGQPVEKTYPYPVAVWSLGDQVDFVFLGGEVVVDVALHLKSERHGRRTWVAGYANDVMAYIPSERVLREGGYEGAGAMVYYGLPTAWAPGVEQTIVDAVTQCCPKK